MTLRIPLVTTETRTSVKASAAKASMYFLMIQYQYGWVIKTGASNNQPVYIVLDEGNCSKSLIPEKLYNYAREIFQLLRLF
ncbi:hypothetical protein GCM10027299_20300 [Larkinella ripae]